MRLGRCRSWNHGRAVGNGGYEFVVAAWVALGICATGRAPLQQFVDLLTEMTGSNHFEGRIQANEAPLSARPPMPVLGLLQRLA